MAWVRGSGYWAVDPCFLSGVSTSFEEPKEKKDKDKKDKKEDKKDKA